MTLEERVQILEDNFRAFITTRANDKLYTDADINGNRNSIANITPTVMTKTAYYGEKEKTFYDVPLGNITVFFNNYNGDYSINRVQNRLIVSFDTLKEKTNITISVMEDR